MRDSSALVMSSMERSRLVIGAKTPPRPVICSTAEIIPVAKSPCPATMARTPGLLIVFLQVATDGRGIAHARDQALVERLGGVDTRVPQQMVHRDHLRDHRNVFARIERHRD